MQIQNVNNQPSFKAQFKLFPSYQWNKLSHEQKRDLNAIARSIGSQKDEIQLEVGHIIEDRTPIGEILRHYMIFGAYCINGKMKLHKISTIARQGQALKQPFYLLKEALGEIKTAADEILKTS